MLPLVSLKVIKEDSGVYRIYLDSDHNFVFSNKREAQDYKRFLQQKLSEGFIFLNERYGEVYKLWRSYFFYVKDFRLRARIENCLEHIENRLNYILLWNHGENSNAYYMSDLRKSLQMLGSVYRLLRDVAISRRDVAVKLDLENKCHILHLYETGFEDFEKKLHYKLYSKEFRISKMWKAC